MNTIIEFFEELVDFFIANPTATRSEAIDFLQTQTNGVSNAEGGAWIDALAVYAESIGWANSPKYNNLRNMVVNDGDVKSKAFFTAVLQSILTSAGFADPVVSDVTRAIRVFDLQRKRDRIQEQIQFIIGARDLLPLPTTPVTNREETAMRRSYNRGLEDLRGERDTLDARINANS